MSDLYVVTDDSLASAGQALQSSVTGNGSQLESQVVTIATERTYTLWIRARAEASGKTFYAGIQGQSLEVVTVTPVGAWIWFDCGSYLLTEGDHTVVFGPGSTDVLMDVLILTNLDLTPPQLEFRIRDTIPPPSQGGSANIASLEGNEAFDPDNPVIFNGTSLTGDALTTWQLIRWHIDNIETRYIPQGGDDLEELAKSNDLYQYARIVASIVNELAVTLRISGWLTALDKWIKVTDWQASKLGLTFGSGYKGVSINHPYRRWLWPRDSSWQYYNTDVHQLDNPRTHAPIAMLLKALKLNSGKTSPAGYDYAAKAAFWEQYLRDWVEVWQGPKAWQNDYKGSLHGYYTGASSSSAYRAGVNGQPIWPIFSRSSTHTHVGCSTAHVYLGDAIPDFAAALPVGMDGIIEAFINRNLFLYQGQYGQQALWPRGLHYTGHATASNPVSNYPQPMTYAGYVQMDLFNLWLDGKLPDYPSRFAVPVARTYSQYALVVTGDPNFYGTSNDLVDDKGPQITAFNSDGQTIPFETSSSNGFGTERSIYNLVTDNHAYMMPFDTPDDKIEEHFFGDFGATDWGAMGERGDLSGDHPFDDPRVLSPYLGLLAKQLNARDWILDETA